MNLQQLRVFVLAVRLKKLTLVARTLGVKQPTASFHMKRLEQEVGMRLFSANSRTSFELTDFGREFYRYAARIVATEDEVQRMLLDHQALRRGKLAIGSTYTPATYVFPRHIARIKQLYPNIDLELQVAGAHILLDRLKRYELDVCIISHYIADPELRSTPIVDDNLVLIAHPEHAMASHDEAGLANVADWDYVMHEQGSVSRMMIDQWTMRHSLSLRIVLEVSATETMKELVKQRMGVAFISEISCREDVAAGSLVARPIPGFWFERKIYMVVRDEDTPSRASQVLQSLILAQTELN